MFTCKICEEKISVSEKFRGTCLSCEAAIAKVMFQKTGQKLYSRKFRLKM